MAKLSDRSHLRAFKPSVKNLNWKQKVKKFVFIKWLAAKIRICFFKNTIQLQLPRKYTAK